MCQVRAPSAEKPSMAISISPSSRLSTGASYGSGSGNDNAAIQRQIGQLLSKMKNLTAQMKALTSANMNATERQKALELLQQQIAALQAQIDALFRQMAEQANNRKYQSTNPLTKTIQASPLALSNTSDAIVDTYA